MHFSHCFYLLLLLIVSSAAAHQTHKAQPTHPKRPAFTLQWSSYDDIQRALAAAPVTVHTSLGNVTYRPESSVGEHKVFRAGAAGALQSSVVVQSRDFATVVFVPEYGGEITVTASPTEFSVVDQPPSDHKCGCSDEESASSRRRFRGSGSPYLPTYYIWEGDGTMLGSRVSTPFFRNFRIVYGSYTKYMQDTLKTSESNMTKLTELFEAKMIAVTATINEWFERELGIHLIYTALATRNETLVKKRPDLVNVSAFFNETFGFDNYDIGVFIGPSTEQFGGVTNTEAVYRSDKGGAYAMVNWNVIAHEVGHMFGAYHTQEYWEDIEPYPGTSIMGYGNLHAVFNLGTLLRINRRYDDHGYSRGKPYVYDFHAVNNTNTIPQINTAPLRKAYHIPHSTSIRFIVDANDADEDDQLDYYVQQMNFDERFLRTNKNGGAYFDNDEYYARGIQGIPTLTKEKVTNSREFYFTEIYLPRILSRILNRTELAAYPGFDPVPDNRTYDIFICAFDNNKEKRNAYFSEYDPLVRNYTLEMVKAQNDTEKINELNATMRAEMKKMDGKAWINRRDTFHTRVIAHANFTPFTLTMTPRKDDYSPGEVVTLSWDCDSRTVPPRDHLTFRLSTDSMESFPIVLASHVPMENRTINITMPYVAIHKKNFFMSNYSNGQFPQGFIMAEHEEGIVFTTTHNRSMYPNEKVYGGGFAISTSSPITQYELRYQGSVIQQIVVKDNDTAVMDLMRGLSVHTKDKQGNKLDKWTYLVANESGEVTDTVNSYVIYASKLAEHLRRHKGTYIKVAAKITLSSSLYDNKRLADMQAWGYKSQWNDFVTNAIDIKMHSTAMLRPPVPQRNTTKPVTDDYTGVAITEDDVRSALAAQERAAKLGSTRESEGDIISISQNCDDKCGACEKFVDYIADGQCHRVPGENKYYMADGCSESDETLRIMFYDREDCPAGTGTEKNFKPSCNAAP